MPPPAVEQVLDSLRALATPTTLAGLARYAIPAEDAWGVAVSDIKALAGPIGRNPALAAALWESGVYDARMMVPFVADPRTLDVATMDRWLVETNNWANCDALCFHLFDRTPHAFACVDAWADRPEEFVRRGAFALLASLALHDKKAPDAAFLDRLVLVERAAPDPRNFVKKGVSWALRSVGRRAGPRRDASIVVAERLAASTEPAARWIGKDALRDFRKK